MFIDLSLQVYFSSVPSSHISHYRWVRQSGQIPIAGFKFTELSLQITLYEEEGEKDKSIVSEI